MSALRHLTIIRIAKNTYGTEYVKKNSADKTDLGFQRTKLIFSDFKKLRDTENLNMPHHMTLSS